MKNRFSSINQPKTQGRKPAQLKKFIKANGVSHQDLSNMIKNVIFANSETELLDMLRDTTKPMIIRLFIKAYLTDFKKGSIQNIMTLFSRAFGMPTQKIETEEVNPIAVMTKEERDLKLQELMNKYLENKNE